MKPVTLINRDRTNGCKTPLSLAWSLCPPVVSFRPLPLPGSMADPDLPLQQPLSAPSSLEEGVVDDSKLPAGLAGAAASSLPLERLVFTTPSLTLALTDPDARDRSLMGFAQLARCYYPSLPRVLEHEVHGQELRLLQPLPGGEPLGSYLQRLGPIMLETACALLWRLATELAHARHLFHGLPSWLDAREARMHLWHRDCLLLTLPSYSARPSLGCDAADEVRLVKELVKLLGRLMGAGPGPELPVHLARRLPTEVLRLFPTGASSPQGGSMGSSGDEALTLADFKKQMIQAIFLMTRRKDTASLDALFRVPSRLFPMQGERTQYVPPAASEVLPDSGRTSVSLIQLLSHRNRLRSGEIRVLQQALERALEAAPAQDVCLDPLHIYLQFSLNGGSLDQRKDLLDTRLQADTGLKARLHAPDPAFDLLSSPVMVSPARQAGKPCALHLTDPAAQLSRLFDVLRSGCYSINAYSADTTPRVRVAASRTPRNRRIQEVGAPISILSLIGDTQPAPPALAAPEGNTLSPDTVSTDQAPESTPLENINEERSELAAAVLPDTYAQPITSATSSMDSHSADDTPPTPPDSANRLVIMTVGSGGIGKSTIARLLYELAGLAEARSVALFDCDATGNRDFQRVAPERVEASPVHDVETIRKMISASLEQPLVIADLPASCHDLVLRDLNPDIIRELRDEDHVEVIPVFPVTAKASTIPAIHQWRKLIFGDAKAVLVINLKDGPVTNDMIQKVHRDGDSIMRMPLLDTALAAALDAIGGLWTDICEGRAGQNEKLFTNPLVRRQLRSKIREMEVVFAPLIQRMKAACQSSVERHD